MRAPIADSCGADLSVVTVAIRSLVSACAQLSYLFSRRRTVDDSAMAGGLAIATTSVLFSLWVAFTAGYQAVYQAMLQPLLGIPIYSFLKARRERRCSTAPSPPSN